MADVQGFGIDFNNLPINIKDWIRKESEKAGMPIPSDEDIAMNVKGAQNAPFFRECKHLDTAFCGTHGSVWPDTEGPAGEKCLYKQVIEWSAHFAHHPSHQTAGGLLGVLGMWVATSGPDE